MEEAFLATWRHYHLLDIAKPNKRLMIMQAGVFQITDAA